MERDGEPEEWRSESIAGGIRIYTGNKDVFLSPGDHTFRIAYQTGRQIRFFADYDELYWNVTGNGWRFRIAQASADVTLPTGTKVNRYGGPIRANLAKAVAMRAFVKGDRVIFTTARPLDAGEG